MAIGLRSINRPARAGKSEARLRAAGLGCRDRIAVRRNNRKGQRDPVARLKPISLNFGDARGINRLFGEVAFHRHRRVSEVGFELGVNSAAAIGNELGDRDDRKQADDCYDKQNFD